MVLTAWPLSDLPTAPDLTVDQFMITVCLRQSQHTLSTKRLRCTPSTPRWLLKELRMGLQDHLVHRDHHRRLLLLLWLRLPCREWTIVPHQLDPRGCESGKRNLPPRSRPVKRTESVLMTCVTEDLPHLLAITTVATLLKFDVLRTHVALRNRAVRSPADLNQHLAMSLRAIIPRMLLTILQAMLLGPATCHQCSKGLLRPCLALFMRSHQVLRRPRRIGHQVWSMLPRLAQLPLQSPKGQRERWMLTRTTMTVERMRRRRRPLSRMALDPAPRLETLKHPLLPMLV